MVGVPAGGGNHLPIRDPAPQHASRQPSAGKPSAAPHQTQKATTAHAATAQSNATPVRGNGLPARQGPAQALSRQIMPPVKPNGPHLAQAQLGETRPPVTPERRESAQAQTRDGRAITQERLYLAEARDRRAVTPERLYLAHASSGETERSDRPAKPQEEPARAPSGTIEYTVQRDDTPATIAGMLGISEKALRDANPMLSKPGSTNVVGRKIVIPKDGLALATIDVGMAAIRAPELLKQLVIESLSYETRDLATPEDRLEAAQQGLIAQHPGDMGFAGIVKAQGEALRQIWAAQGRTHAVWDPLLADVNEGNWPGLQADVADILHRLAKTAPTPGEVEDYRKLLLAYGPKDPRTAPLFKKAVNNAVLQLGAGDSAGAAQPAPAREDLARALSGEVVYTVRANDTPAKIAKLFEVSVDALRAANPALNASRRYLLVGQKIVILNTRRAKIAVEMANARDPEVLRRLAAEDLYYATLGFAMPEDRVEGAEKRMSARRPGDDVFAGIVRDAGKALKEAWTAEAKNPGELNWLVDQDLFHTTLHLAKPEDGLKDAEHALFARRPHDHDYAGVVKAQGEALRQAWKHKTENPELLKQLVTAELNNATQNLATPEDELDAAEKRLTALHRGDGAFAKIVQAQGEALKEVWAKQGRTHAVWDPLLADAKDDNWPGVQAEVVKIFHTLAKTTPTLDAVESYRKLLLAYGPRDPRTAPLFEKAFNDGVQQFRVGDPQAAAARVAAAHQSGGYEAASKELRDQTDPNKADPLTAALIAQNAKSTIDAILMDIARKKQHLQALSRYPHSDAVEVDVALGFQEFFRIYRNMSAVADSIERSPEGKKTFTQMADAFAVLGRSVIDSKYAVQDGSGAALSLAVATRLLEMHDKEGADFVAGGVLAGLETFKQTVREDADTLFHAEATLINPGINWGPFLEGVSSLQTPDMKEWLDKHPELVAKLQSATDRINLSGYQLRRAIAGVNEYAPALQGLRNQAELLHQGKADFMNEKTEDGQDNKEWDRRLARALVLSVAGLEDELRQENLDGLQNRVLADVSKIIPDPSWPLRIVRNTSQSAAALLSGDRPFNVGLQLYGMATYASGTVTHARELWNKIQADGLRKGVIDDFGWRNAGYLGMYGSGFLIESGQVYALIATRLMNLKPDDPVWWRRELAMGAKAPSVANMPGSGVLGRLFIYQLKAFGAYNALGAVAFALKGEWPDAVARALAATGTLISTTPEVAAALRLGKAGGLVGNLLTLAGAGGAYFLHRSKKEEILAEIEALHEDYLKAAGVKPEIAHALALIDDDGVSGAQRLLALASYRHIKPAELLEWLNGKDAKFVDRFVRDGLLPLNADRNGNYVQRVGGQSEVLVTWGTTPDEIVPPDPNLIRIEALSLEGDVTLAKMLGHPMPGSS
jgi:LysM repeat protein